MSLFSDVECGGEIGNLQVSIILQQRGLLGGRVLALATGALCAGVREAYAKSARGAGGGQGLLNLSSGLGSRFLDDEISGNEDVHSLRPRLSYSRSTPSRMDEKCTHHPF